MKRFQLLQLIPFVGMSRRLLTTALFLSFCFTACNNGDDSDEPTVQQPVADEETEIVEENNGTPKYHEGQRVEVNIDGKGIWYKGYIKEVHDPVTAGGYYLVHLDEAMDAVGSIAFTIGTNSYNLMRPEGGTTLSSTVNCSFGPPPGSFTNSSPASIALFKKIVYDRHSLSITGTAGAPVRIGIKFISIKPGEPYKNTALQNNSAPVDAIIYPAAIKYIICEDIPPGITRRMIETKHEFFMARDGWSFSSPNPLDKVTILE